MNVYVNASITERARVAYGLAAIRNSGMGGECADISLRYLAQGRNGHTDANYYNLVSWTGILPASTSASTLCYFLHVSLFQNRVSLKNNNCTAIPFPSSRRN